MNDENTLHRVLDFILNQATSEELEVIAGALKRRRQGMAGGFSPQGMAHDLARRVQAQLGTLDVWSFSRKVVSDLIRQKETGISEEDLKILLDKLLPASGETPVAGPRKPPPDVLITMIVQYLAYKRGKLSADEQKGLPENWDREYWQALPDTCRRLITKYLSGKLTENLFWEEIVKNLGQ